jgi:bifunctional polynucleotide phosphatase/kinase
MSWKSVNNSNGLLYYCEPVNKFNSDKVLALDLDHTVIKPEIGKSFPVSIDDWIFAFNMNKVREYSRKGYKIVIMSNQKGSYQGKGKLTFDDFKERWFTILKGLNVPAYILAAPQDDFYRKPFIGMWKYMKSHLNGDIKIDKSKCLFIGDAAGRRGDHSDVDIKFAINIGIDFKTPEEFFENSQDYPFDSLKKNLKGFNPKEYLSNISDIDKINRHSWKELSEKIKNNKMVKMIIMVGSPASGKTTLINLIQEKVKKHNLKWDALSLDIEKTKKKMKDKIAKLLVKDENNENENENINVDGVIIDATNSTKENRKEWLDVLEKVNPDFKAICVYLNVEKDLVLHLNELRAVKKTIDPSYHSKNVPTVAIHTYWKKLEKPDKDEKFEEIIEFNFEPNFKNNEEKKQFLTWI